MAFRIRRVGHLVLRVKDVNRSRKFFEEVLGFPVVGQNEWWLVFFCNDAKDNHQEHQLPAAEDHNTSRHDDRMDQQ